MRRDRDAHSHSVTRELEIGDDILWADFAPEVIWNDGGWFVGLRLGPRRGLRAGREGFGEWAISSCRSRLQGGWPRCDFIKQRGPCGRRLQLVRRRRRGVSESERRRTYDGQIGCGPGLFFGGHCLHRPVALVMPLREPGGASLGCQSRQEHQ